MTIQRRDPRVTIGHPELDLVTLPAPPEWTIEAICAQVDLDLFFPEKGGSTRDAKEICAACPVRLKCLDYALEQEAHLAGSRGSIHGIWGGLSPQERMKLIRARRRAEATEDGAA